MDIPGCIKEPAVREPVKRLHVLVMTDGGSTRRFSLSTTFLWIIVSITLLVFLALGVLSYLASSLLVDNRRLQTRYDFEIRRLETQAYNRTIPDTGEAAGRILERLDQAALSARDDAPDLPDPVPAAPDGGAVSVDGGGGAAEAGAPPPPAGSAQAAPAGRNPAGQVTAGDGPDADPAQAEIPGAPAAGEDGDGVAAPPGAAGPEEEAWAALHKRLALPSGVPVLDVDEFRFSPDGSFTYYLKKITEPGDRLRGRAITVFSVRDRGGKVALVSDPEIDLRNPSQGWDRGGRYNIIASKVYKGRIRIPQGGMALAAEVLAWEEDTKALVFLKRVPLEGGE
ncbi:MAG: hypothetical protein LBG06_08040 [Deltaproteobacteria bacterium]|nr:hypothetical protein [Deltaproteobacteria bacterium]